MRGLVVLALIVAVIGFGVEKMRAEPGSSGSCAGGHGPIGWADCQPEPDSPDDLSIDYAPELEPCDDARFRLEDAVYADAGVDGGEPSCRR